MEHKESKTSDMDNSSKKNSGNKDGSNTGNQAVPESGNPGPQAGSLGMEADTTGGGSVPESQGEGIIPDVEADNRARGPQNERKDAQ